LGILLKYIPIVILPFLVFSERRFHFRLLSFCIGVLVSGLALSLFIWGISTLSPFTFLATRRSAWSIYVVLASTHSPLRLFLASPNVEPNVDWLDKPLLLTTGLAMFTWCSLRQIEPALSSALAILVTLLFYRVGYVNYQMLVFSLISYWLVSNWAQIKEHSVLAALLAGYFSYLAIGEFVIIFGLVGSIFYSNIAFMLIRFLLGCALLIGLVQLRPTPRKA
jgi:hypothetical protein